MAFQKTVEITVVSTAAIVEYLSANFIHENTVHLSGSIHNNGKLKNEGSIRERISQEWLTSLHGNSSHLLRCDSKKTIPPDTSQFQRLFCKCNLVFWKFAL